MHWLICCIKNSKTLGIVVPEGKKWHFVSASFPCKGLVCHIFDRCIPWFWKRIWHGSISGNICLIAVSNPARFDAFIKKRTILSLNSWTTMLPSMISLLERCFWRLRFYYYLFLKFLRPIQWENVAWSTVIVPVFCWRKWGFSREEILAYCAVVFQSCGCLPPFSAVVAKRYKTMLWRAEVHLNMSTYPQRNSSG